jgi:ribosomal-protein-alanine acetyltransferase
MLRFAAEQDFEWIAAIQSKANLPLWRPNLTSWVLDKKAFAIWQAAGDECELLSIAVEPAEQGKGFARMLMAHCHKELAEQGFRSFFLEVREGNAPAISLYKKLGYEKVSERKKYYDNGENALIFKYYFVAAFNNASAFKDGFASVL